MELNRISPCLWFDDKAEEAVNFYTSLFKNSKIGTVLRYDKATSAVSGQPEGSVMTVDFEIAGMTFTALNGGPMFKFTEAVSFMVSCDTQDEVDNLWEKLSEGGEESQCGWLKDKFGLSWQVVPKEMYDFMNDPDPEKVSRVMQAILQMKKLDIEEMRKAYAA